MHDDSGDSDRKIRGLIKDYCKTSFGALDSSFLCQSISALSPKIPISVPPEMSLIEVAQVLAEQKIGCVLVVNSKGAVIGIFSERDCVRKIVAKGIALDSRTVGEFMTPDPVCQPADITVAYALNLMSHGGFRHLPLVDSDHLPIGIVSVKDVLDHLVNGFFDELLNFPVEEEGAP